MIRKLACSFVVAMIACGDSGSGGSGASGGNGSGGDPSGGAPPFGGGGSSFGGAPSGGSPSTGGGGSGGDPSMGGAGGSIGEGGAFEGECAINPAVRCDPDLEAFCLCNGCDQEQCFDAQTGTLADCVCDVCASDEFCTDMANCTDGDGCDPVVEGCHCADCENHAQCQ